MSQLSLTEGNVRRALSRFAIPFLGASLLQFLYGAVDLIVVGQFADQAGIAAVSTGSQVMQAVTNFIIGLSTGGTVLVGQYLGARRGEDVNRAIGTLFSLFALIAVVLAAAFALSTNAIVALMQVPAAAVAPARQYLFICACGLVFITGYNMVSGVLRGLGDTAAEVRSVSDALAHAGASNPHRETASPAATPSCRSGSDMSAASVREV